VDNVKCIGIVFLICVTVGREYYGLAYRLLNQTLSLMVEDRPNHVGMFK